VTALRLETDTLYGSVLNPFPQLHLICHSFNQILTDYVKVDGMPVEKQFLKYQRKNSKIGLKMWTG
jgi:hypothetical protein